MATVFVFTGRAYYGKPGIDWHMAEVQEDYAERRPFKGSWAKAQSWMVTHGYRRLWATPVGRDGCDVTQVWGLVRVFGDTNVTYTGSHAVRTRYERWLAEHQPKEAQPSMTEHMLQQLQRAYALETCQYAHAHPELTAREVNEMMKARACGNV